MPSGAVWGYADVSGVYVCEKQVCGLDSQTCVAWQSKEDKSHRCQVSQPSFKMIVGTLVLSRPAGYVLAGDLFLQV